MNICFDYAYMVCVDDGVVDVEVNVVVLSTVEITEPELTWELSITKTSLYKVMAILWQL